VPELFPIHYSGLNENRCSAFITVDRAEIERRMKAYFDGSIPLEDLAEYVPGVDYRAAGYDPALTRNALLANSAFDTQLVMPLSYRPLDDWWMYWEGKSKLFNRPRPDYFAQVWPGNLFLSASQTARKGGFNSPTIVDKFGDLHLQDPWSQFFPLFVRSIGDLKGERTEPNVAHELLEVLCGTQTVKPYEKDGHAWSPLACHPLVPCLPH
jgi:hypothetical protein